MTHIRLIGLVAALFHTIATTPYAAAKLGEAHPPRENRGLIYNDPQPAKKACTSLDVALPKTAGYHPDIDDQVKNVKTRIIGGTEVDGTNIYPFFVSWGGSCGGSLIHSDIVLTAAHCGEIVDPIVVINAYALDNAADSPNVVTNTEGTVVRTIESRSMHPLYDDTTVANDFLLLKLNKPVTGIDPIPINDVGSTPSTGEKLKVIGLGNTSEGGLSQPDFLREVIVSAVSDSSCDASYASYGGIKKDVMFCAGATGKDSCQGDSGGPIFTLTETGDFASQVGVVSWGIGCADSNFPGVYAEISTAKDWIDSEICKLSNNKPSSCAGSEPVSDSDDNGGSKSSVDVIVRTDAYPEEISWTLMDNDGAVLSSVAKGTYSDENESFSTTVELIEGAQYTFEIKDSYGDGICCSDSSGNGYYTVKVGDTLLATGGEYESSESTTFTVPRGEEDTGDNESEDEPIDENNGSKASVDVIVRTDAYPEEISWTLIDNDGAVLSSVAKGTYSDGNESFSTTVELIEGAQYTFEIKDSYGDGICCSDSSGNGYYEIKVGETLLATGGEYESSESTTFTVPRGEEDTGDNEPEDEPIDENNGSKASVDVIVRTDAYPEEISWTLMDNDGAVLSSVAKGTYSDGNESFSATVELIKGAQYTFEIKDSYGDGICCSSSSGNGYYEIKVGETLLATGGEYESSESTTFTVPRGEEDTRNGEPEDEPIDENQEIVQKERDETVDEEGGSSLSDEGVGEGDSSSSHSMVMKGSGLVSAVVAFAFL